jgi:hypothetical protein
MIVDIIGRHNGSYTTLPVDGGLIGVFVTAIGRDGQGEGRPAIQVVT